MCRKDGLRRKSTGHHLLLLDPVRLLDRVGVRAEARKARDDLDQEGIAGLPQTRRGAYPATQIV